MAVLLDDSMQVQASTPDPDAPPCDFCGGGLAHYPECPELDPGFTEEDDL